MKRYAVAAVNFIGDTTLEIKVVRAQTWRGALHFAFPKLASYLTEVDLHLEKAKQQADDQDWQFDVVEV